MCGKKHAGECLFGTNSGYWLWKRFHILEDFPNVRTHGKGNIQAQPSGPSSETPKRNRFYTLKARSEQERSPNVVTCMLQVFMLISIHCLIKVHM